VQQLDSTPSPAPASTSAPAAAAAQDKSTKSWMGLSKAPASTSAAPKDPMAGAAVLRYKLRFSPLKALSCTVQLAVVRSTGGRWLFDINLMVSLGVLNCVLHAASFGKMNIVPVCCTEVALEHAQITIVLVTMVNFNSMMLLFAGYFYSLIEENNTMCAFF
jgi:hypothetical protein